MKKYAPKVESGIRRQGELADAVPFVRRLVDRSGVDQPAAAQMTAVEHDIVVAVFVVARDVQRAVFAHGYRCVCLAEDTIGRRPVAVRPAAFGCGELALHDFVAAVVEKLRPLRDKRARAFLHELDVSVDAHGGVCHHDIRRHIDMQFAAIRRGRDSSRRGRADDLHVVHRHSFAACAGDLQRVRSCR